MGWLAMAERYLRANHVPFHDKVQTAATHFGPDASVWMNAFEMRQPNPTWDEFVTALLARFGAGSNSDFKGMLAHLQQTSSLEEFITAFTKLSCRAPDWPESELVHIFVDGLRPELLHDVRAMRPTTLAEAQRLARCYETRNVALRPPNPFRPSGA